jgi:predicted acetyltransferase
MVTTLHVAERSDSALIENLMQFYFYDFSELLPAVRVGADGKFAPRSLDPYWQDAWRHPRLIRVDEHPAGFALIQRGSHLRQDPDTWDVCEFFVMRQYRRQGVGADAALQMFEQFRGRWEVRQVHANAAATYFWRAVIARHTDGQYSESTHEDERWRGPVQSFDNTQGAPDTLAR